MASATTTIGTLRPDAPDTGSPGRGPTRPGRTDRRAWFVPSAAAATVGVLSLIGLGRRSLWLDEAISLGATHELVPTWKNTGGTMGLYYAILTPWAKVSAEPAWLRLLSVAFVMAAVVAAWAAFRRLGGDRLAAAASTVLALSWVVVRYAQEARSYALVLLLATTAWLALIAAVQEDDPVRRRRWWTLYVAATVLAPLAHGLAVLQFVAQVGVLVVAPDRAAWFKRLRPVVIVQAVELCALFSIGASDVASWIPPLAPTQILDLVRAFTGPGILAALVLGAAAIEGVVIALRRYQESADPLARWLTVVPIAWGLVPPVLLLVVSVARPYLLARYVAASAPGIALLIALAVVGTSRPSRVRLAVVGIPVLIALGAGQVALHRERGDDWAHAADRIAAEAEPGDAIVFPNPSVRGAFDAAWADGARSTAPATISPVEPLGGIRRLYRVVDPGALPSVVAGGDADRVWVVDQMDKGDGDLAAFRADPALAGFHVAAVGWYSGGVQVILLERA